MRGGPAPTQPADSMGVTLDMSLRHGTRSLRQGLEVVDAVLAEELPPGILLRMVAGDADWPLDDDPTDAGAAELLREPARLIRSLLDEVP